MVGIEATEASAGYFTILLQKLDSVVTVKKSPDPTGATTNNKITTHARINISQYNISIFRHAEVHIYR